MSYTPTPGSIPARAIAHLQSLPAGAKIPGAELAAAVGLEEAISPYVQSPIKHGLLVVTSDPNNRRLSLYSLGDGTAPIRPEDLAPDEPLEPAPAANRPVPVSAFDTARIVARAASRPPVAQTKTPPPGFRAGLFTDGTLLIESDGASITLAADQVQQLRQLIAGATA